MIKKSNLTCFRLGWLRKCPVLQVMSSVAVLKIGFVNRWPLKMSHDHMHYHVRDINRQFPPLPKKLFSDHGSQFLPLPLRHPYGEHKPNSQGGHKHDESSRLSKEKIVKSIKIKAAQLSKLMR